jgi:diaminopimelate epimerase
MHPTRPPAAPMHLSKHHGAGNDFLVLVDEEGAVALDPTLVRALCDRHRGVGADGVIRVLGRSGSADLVMDLRNADGSVAELTGNGMRCLAQAAVAAGLVRPPSFTVETLSGVRTVRYSPGEDPSAATASVELGRVDVGDEEPEPVEGRRARRVDVGNPHLVLLGGDPATVDVAASGPRIADAVPGGVNVEFVAVDEATRSLTLRVWERGVGETEACGTGSVAAAAAARAWGLVDGAVDVHNPGGSLRVTFDGGVATLAGPVRKVADVVVDPHAVLEAVRR